MASFDHQLSAVRLADPLVKRAVLAKAAGIPFESLDGRHHPCPKCGGKDRFRLFDAKAGAVFCNQCFGYANADIFAAVQHYRVTTFPEAVAICYEAMQAIGAQVAVGDDRNGAISSLDGSAPGAGRDQEVLRQRLVNLWASCQRNTERLAAYFIYRGLPGDVASGSEVDLAPKQWFFDRRGKRGEFDAMTGAFFRGGQLVGLHQTFLSDTGPGKLQLDGNKRFVKGSSATGAAIPLRKHLQGSLDCPLVICEGIETGLAIVAALATVKYPGGVWACCTCNLMTKVILPDDIAGCIVMADNDGHGGGQNAAAELVKRARQRGIPSRAAVPRDADCDWLDVYNRYGASAVISGFDSAWLEAK